MFCKPRASFCRLNLSSFIWTLITFHCTKVTESPFRWNVNRNENLLILKIESRLVIISNTMASFQHQLCDRSKFLNYEWFWNHKSWNRWKFINYGIPSRWRIFFNCLRDTFLRIINAFLAKILIRLQMNSLRAFIFFLNVIKKREKNVQINKVFYVDCHGQ